MPALIKFRRATTLKWLEADPILDAGEPGFETNTGKFKVGDGLRSWSELDYFVMFEPVDNDSLPAHVNSDLPHPVYDDGPSFALLYENAKV